METPKRTAGTGTRDLGSAGTPEYIKMEAGKINLNVGKRERETERGREKKRDFHSNVRWSNMLICHYFVHIVKKNYIFICTLLRCQIYCNFAHSITLI